MPSSGVSRPAMHRSMVDLPQPEGPSRDTNSPGVMLTEVECSQVLSPNSQRISVNSRPTGSGKEIFTMCPLSGAYPLAGTQQARTEEVENSCLNARVSTV